MRTTLLLLGLLTLLGPNAGCGAVPEVTRSRHRTENRYSPPAGLNASHSIGAVNIWVDPNWEATARTWRLFLPQVRTRLAQGQGSKETGLDVEWGCQAFESALRRELHDHAFEIVNRPRPGLYRLEVILEGQARASALQTPVWIQASLSVPGHQKPVLILRTPAVGSPIQENGVMRTWGEGKKAVRAWARQLASALKQVRSSRVL
ncbi:MAG TPA: hypothetical protein EYQ25_13740 [Planctomycetes bacterium]|nr:hypothetical protein [Planctomycetota bacterium]HIL38523.1 hypothetical protein [Planctomycetota bacterium]